MPRFIAWDAANDANERRQLTIPGTPADYINPDWNSSGTCHDWKNHISDEVAAMWSLFSIDQKGALARQAESLANAEQWD